MIKKPSNFKLVCNGILYCHFYCDKIWSSVKQTGKGFLLLSSLG